MADPANPPDSHVNNEEASDMSPQDRLADLTAKATAEYAVKHYSEAAEMYSQATELQAELNGEMAIENADLLYSYGKCLFYLAQQTSSVLGGTAASAQLSKNKEKPELKKRRAKATPKPPPANGPGNGESSMAAAVSTEPSPNVGDVKTETNTLPDKPLFQITGDENWDDSEDEAEASDDHPDHEEGEEGEEEDDFANAFELLDLARVLYLRKLEQLEESTLQEANKGKYVPSIDLAPPIKEVKKRIADIYDLQAEVSLEGEKYAAAVTDLKSCLALKEELEPRESTILAECHYKLSLALEFSSQTQQRDADGNPVGDLEVDWDIRNEAIAQQEKAIDCCRLRIAKETKEMDQLENGKEKDKMMAQIEDMQDMIAEMEVRLAELAKPPVSVKAETEMKEQISGVLGSIIGASAEEQKERLAKAAETANDLTGLVKKKKHKATDGPDSGFGSAASTPVPVPESSIEGGKRRVEFMDEAEDCPVGKKAKVEDVEDDQHGL